MKDLTIYISEESVFYEESEELWGAQYHYATEEEKKLDDEGKVFLTREEVTIGERRYTDAKGIPIDEILKLINKAKANESNN